MEDAIRVLIADDHPLFREGMRGRLERVADVEVVGEVSSGDEAVGHARELKPAVVLMDIKIPGMNGREATREILRANPEIGVLVLTMFEDDDSVFAAMRAGAKGYLLKESGGEEVVQAIRPWRAGMPSSGPGWPSASWVSSPPLGRLRRNARPRSSPNARRCSPWSPKARAIRRYPVSCS